MKIVNFLGEEAIKQQRPYISNCYSLGLVDAAAPVIINGQHVATWLIGQANIDNVDEERVIEYAKEVGADADKMLGLYNELQTKPEEDFRAKVELLWETSQHLAGRAYDKIYLEERVKEQTKVLEEKNRQLEELAYTDGETSCYNKKYLLQQLPKEMKRSGRFNHDLTLIMADLDYFKEINDQHGHLCGDRILEGIGGILQNNIRNGIDWVARYGGEEFLIVLPETNANDAYNVAERMRSKIDGSEFEYCDESIKLTASFGIGSYSPGMNLDALLNKADKNLYAAKNSGRDKVY